MTWKTGDRVKFIDVAGRDGEPLTGDMIVRDGTVTGDPITNADTGDPVFVPVFAPPNHSIYVHVANIMETNDDRP